MKRAVNLRLEESIILTLNQLASDLNTTKTEVDNALKKLDNNLAKFISTSSVA